jgi:hypothetical protein
MDQHLAFQQAGLAGADKHADGIVGHGELALNGVNRTTA